MKTTILLEIESRDRTLVTQFLDAEPTSVEFLDINRFEGDTEITNALLVISSITIPLIAKIIIELIKSARFRSVKYKGVEIKGISKADSEKIVSSILKSISDKQ